MLPHVLTFVICGFPLCTCVLFITIPQAPPNFLRAAALGEYKKPVVVVPNEERHEEEEVEPQPEFREAPQMPQVHASQKFNNVNVFLLFFPVSRLTFSLFSWQYYLLSQMGAPDASLEQRETENDSLKRELEVLKPELQLIKSEVSWAS